MTEKDRKVLHLGIWDARLVREGSVRALLTELIIENLKEFDNDESLHFKRHDEYNELRQAAVMSDPLWPQVMAALSIGPLEFGRFEGERLQGIINWPSRLEVAIERLLKESGKEIAHVTFLNADAQAKVELDYFTDASGLLYAEVI